MEVTLFGIVIFVSNEHPSKAYIPIFVILFGMIIVLTSCSINVLLFNILTDSGSLIPFNTVFPNKTFLPIISIIFGIVFIAMGVLKLVEYFTSETKEDYLLTIALVAVVFGVIVLFASDSIISLFRIILGVWIIAAGIMDFQTTLIWKEVKSVYWTLTLVFSMLMIIAGIVILINSDILFTTIGVITIIYAVLDIIDRIIFMNKIKDYIKE